ncbi:MAG: CDP-alcohol phosphatidyltransferase family protein [Bacteroidota bacterium]|nr:CDP-alcohol phosphatidyltransferase family protein [Kiloniellaceae bacterium]
MDAETTSRPAAACILGDAPAQVWYDSTARRLRRGLARAGAADFAAEGDLPQRDGPVVVLRGDAVIDGPLLQALLRSPGAVLLSNGDPAGRPIAAHAPAGLAAAAAQALRSGEIAALPSGLRVVTAADLGASYWAALRKREEPYALLVRPERIARIEWRMFMGTYKGATDLVTKWLWPWPAFHATKLCARLGVTPNQVTFASLLLVIAAFIWFWQGAWWPGLAAAWGMTFLDTVDGKLARITMQSSKWGNAFDHGIDLVHPPFWYWAWAVGLQNSAHAVDDAALLLMLAVIVGGYVLQRAVEGIAIWRLGLEIHIWRRIDTWFRLVTARRNPNLLLLTLFSAFGRPDLGLAAVAVWTAVCLALHLVQLGQGLVAARGGRLKSWMAGPA